MSDYRKSMAEIMARTEAATDGPWTAGRNVASVFDATNKADGRICDAKNHGPENWGNVAFIANARRDLPRMVRMVEALALKVSALQNPYCSEEAHSAKARDATQRAWDESEAG